MFWKTPQTFSLPHPSIHQDTAERTVASGEKARGAAHRLLHPRAGQVLPAGLQLPEKSGGGAGRGADGCVPGLGAAGQPAGPVEGGYEDPLPADDSLAARVDALPPEVSTVIRLRFYEELSLKEISAVTGAPLSTVKTRLYTGLKKLRVSLEGVYDP